ncbi:MAG TPA: stage II sporulation protein D [Candidatus Onthovicinus excrementipullorum]|nr:stage II sporulation protein D [Candidatus Onthovicinus excrementipullorum]
MRQILALALVLTAVMLAAPAISLIPDTAPPRAEAPEDPSAAVEDDGTFRVLLSGTGEVITLSERDYLIGAVCAEMPPLYHAQALRAQAVAIYTNAWRARSAQRADPDPDLKGADFTDSADSHQGYLTEAELREKFGENYDRYIEPVTQAVDDVIGHVITYEGAPITAAFHAICSGRTESAAVIWGKDLPYLQPVVSTGDKLSPDYSSTLVLTADQFREKTGALDGANLSGDTGSWVGKSETSESGTVTKIPIGGKDFTGEQVRAAFGLRSPCFTLTYADGTFTFEVCGYGHGVGMSQYGADYMARQGSIWEEILTHYYTGVKIEKLK